MDKKARHQQKKDRLVGFQEGNNSAAPEPGRQGDRESEDGAAGGRPPCGYREESQRRDHTKGCRVIGEGLMEDVAHVRAAPAAAAAGDSWARAWRATTNGSRCLALSAP